MVGFTVATSAPERSLPAGDEASRPAVPMIPSTVALSLAVALAASGAGIPEAIHRDYLRGTTSVHLASDPTTIPLRGVSWFGHYRSPYLTVYVNGHGPYTFLFDTGSSVTTISSKVARETSPLIVSDVPGHHTIVKLREVRTSGISMRNYYAVVVDGDGVDGILGFNAFGAYALTFDLRNRTLRVGSHPPRLPGAFRLPYTLKLHLPTVNLHIDGRTLPTLIDSGDDAYAWEGTSNDLRGLLFDERPVESAVVFNDKTGATRTQITSLDGRLELGPMYADRPAVAINEALPLPDIGVDVIDQFVISFDRAHRRVAFQPLFAGRTFTVPGELTYGVFISFQQSQRRVRDVLPALLPAREGMMPGDPIVKMDGRNARAVSFRRWDEALRMRRPMSIVWTHDGQTRSATFPVLELR